MIFHGIMLDLETLGINPQAPIVQIGLVKFSIDFDTLMYKIDNNLELNLVPDLTHADFSTIQWWMEQSDQARNGVFSKKERVNEAQAIIMINKWLDSQNVTLPDHIAPIGKENFRLCGHASFDIPILNSMFLRHGCKMPFNHRLYCDLRTLEKTVKVDRVFRTGIHHTAIDDCIYQITHLYNIFLKLHSYGVQICE